jgi:hypothetical protein
MDGRSEKLRRGKKRDRASEGITRSEDDVIALAGEEGSVGAAGSQKLIVGAHLRHLSGHGCEQLLSNSIKSRHLGPIATTASSHQVYTRSRLLPA